MKAFLVSFLVGVLVGIFYGVLCVRSPAPPLLALMGLLGMVIGEAAWLRASAFIAKAVRW